MRLAPRAGSASSGPWTSPSGNCGIPASRSPSCAPIRARPGAGAVPRNLSRVSMEPKMWPQTSFEACILRAILSVQSCGTWQSGQVARTPERLVKWIVPFSSSKTLSRISWQLMQNVSVLVASSDGVEAAPEEHAGDEAAERQEGEAERSAPGEQDCRPVAAATVADEPASTPVVIVSGARRSRLGHRVHVGEPVVHQRRRVGLRDVAGKADVAPRRHPAEEVAVAVLVVGDADHRRLALLGELARVAGHAAVGVEVERVALDGVRDERRLVGVVAAAGARRR